MTIKPIDLTGGKSVFCFNEQQLHGARSLFKSEGESGDKIRAYVEELKANCSRNERASIAFMIIEELNESSEY